MLTCVLKQKNMYPKSQCQNLRSPRPRRNQLQHPHHVRNGPHQQLCLGLMMFPLRRKKQRRVQEKRNLQTRRTARTVIVILFQFHAYTEYIVSGFVSMHALKVLMCLFHVLQSTNSTQTVFLRFQFLRSRVIFQTAKQFLPLSSKAAGEKTIENGSQKCAQPHLSQPAPQVEKGDARWCQHDK